MNNTINNRINFTGLKNMSYGKEIANATKERWLNVELSGYDLHKFKRALKRSNLDKKLYTNPIKSGFLNINTYSIPNDDAIAINNNLLEVDDTTLPMFTELARITGKIIRTKESKFTFDQYYFNSDICRTALLMDPGNPMNNETLVRTHVNKRVKAGAKSINTIIQRIMKRYFSE